MNSYPMMVAMSTMNMLSRIEDDRELNKEERLLQNQCCRTLKESLRYSEACYSKLAKDAEEYNETGNSTGRDAP